MSNQLLRLFIQRTLREGSNITGAGIVVVRKKKGNWQVLCLIKDGEYDLPKGHIEDGEEPFEAALRETEEEASITDLNFKWGKVSKVTNNRLVMFLAQTSQEGHVAPNPETKKLEHEKVEWVSFDQAKSGALDFLIPSLEWAESRISA